MKPKSETVVFFGSGPVAKASLDALARHYPIEALITKPQTRHEMQSGLENVPVHAVSNKQELTDLIKDSGFKSRLGVIVDFGIIVERYVIDSFPLGILNAHFSLLPQWRGADPITFSLLSGQSETGISLMLINEALDEGELIAQENLLINETWTGQDLTDALVALSSDMLKRYLPAYFAGKLHPYPQDNTKEASYSRKLTKADGRLDWNKPAAVLAREVRAFSIWPKSYTTLGGFDVVITKAHADNTIDGASGEVKIIDKKTFAVGTSEGFLVIDELKPAGKGTMSAGAFLAGYRNRL